VDPAETVSTLAVVVALASVAIAALALRHATKQARTTFEEALAREYRDITGRLPLPLFYEHGLVTLTDPQRQTMFQYFDLSNEQLRLIQEKRIRGKTAEDWSSGITELMTRETVRAYWDELRQDLPADFFTYLTQVRAPDY